MADTGEHSLETLAASTSVGNAQGHLTGLYREAQAAGLDPVEISDRSGLSRASVYKAWAEATDE